MADVSSANLRRVLHHFLDARVQPDPGARLSRSQLYQHVMPLLYTHGFTNSVSCGRFLCETDELILELLAPRFAPHWETSFSGSAQWVGFADCAIP